MTEIFSSNPTLSTVKQALNGLAKRQELISHNLANVDTPGYKAKQVNFEQALNQELSRSRDLDLASTRAGHLKPSEGKSRQFKTSLRRGGIPRADGNNVDIDRELLEMTDTNLRFEALTTLLNKKYRLLKEIASRR
jgi:flagellar basal-body rod protein FlgB